MCRQWVDVPESPVVYPTQPPTASTHRSPTDQVMLAIFAITVLVFVVLVLGLAGLL
jgi:hypothetical protein